MLYISFDVNFCALHIQSLNGIARQYLLQPQGLLGRFWSHQKIRCKSLWRRRNTRYKSPQLIAQHCFVASFGSMFRVINLSHNKNICGKLKKCSVLICWFAWCGSKSSCEFGDKRATKPKFVAQSSPALNFSQQLSSTRNRCFCCATSWSREVKNAKHRP